MLRGKMTGANVPFSEEKKRNEKDGDFYHSYFWVGTSRVGFSFLDILWNVIWTEGLLSGPRDSRVAWRKGSGQCSLARMPASFTRST